MENNDKLIYANDFLKALNERPLDFLDVGGDFGYFDETIDSVVDEQPSVDAVEVVHGRWIDAREYCGDYMCSNCDALYGTNKFNYCPDCGAKMDGVQK